MPHPNTAAARASGARKFNCGGAGFLFKGIETSGNSQNGTSQCKGIANSIVETQQLAVRLLLHHEGGPSMKPTMRLVTLSLAFLLLAFGLHAQTKKKTGATAHPPKTISASGCVQAGVEAGCLVLTDKKTNTVYNLFFTGDKPQIDTAIHFTGTLHDGPTTCQQGTPVDVKKWEPLKKTKCTAEKPQSK